MITEGSSSLPLPFASTILPFPLVETEALLPLAGPFAFRAFEVIKGLVAGLVANLGVTVARLALGSVFTLTSAFDGSGGLDEVFLTTVALRVE